MQYLNTIALCVQGNGNWRLMVDYRQLNSVVTPTAPTVPDIATITESTAQMDGTWHAVLDTANTFFPILFGPKAKGPDQFVFMAKPPIHVCKNFPGSKINEGTFLIFCPSEPSWNFPQEGKCPGVALPNNLLDFWICVCYPSSDG